MGDIDISENEIAALKLHPKFSVIQPLPEDALDLEKELAFAKLRMQLSKENDESLDDEDEIEITDEEQEKIDEIEAKSRQIFDPVNKMYDKRKRCVTDLPECSRVTLPKPLVARDEALIEIRRDVIGKIF